MGSVPAPSSNESEPAPCGRPLTVLRTRRGSAADVGRALVAIVVTVAIVGLVACADTTSSADGSAPPGDAGGRGTVVRVVDGDTLVVSIGGSEQRVRLIGIDTPETKKPDTPVQCFGPEASDRTTQLLPAGTAVRLERDAELNDRYGRLLAYVYRDGETTSINERLLDEGDARILRIAPNTAYATRFAAVARTAQLARRGLWGACVTTAG